jgi:hypothetical protein
LLDRLPGGETALFLTAMALAAVVTALLNLDASVAFLPPVLIHLARRRGAREEPFLYGCVLMSNAASLLLPESNLTNLLVLADEHVSGSLFLARMAVTWLAAVAVTAAVDGIAFRHGKAPAYPDGDTVGQGRQAAVCPDTWRPPSVPGWTDPGAGEPVGLRIGVHRRGVGRGPTARRRELEVAGSDGGTDAGAREHPVELGEDLARQVRAEDEGVIAYPATPEGWVERDPLVEGEAVVLRRPAPSLATVHRKASSLAARHGWPEPSYAWYVPPPERLTPPCWSWPTRATRPSGAHQPLGRPSGPPAIRPAPTRDQDKLG